MKLAESEIRRGMRIDWDVGIPMDDGIVLRCDVYRPVKEGRYPVIMSYGPYGKWLHFDDGYKSQWRIMTESYPEMASDTSNEFQNWEVVDPEKWIPDDYVVIRVDSRGCGRSPGIIDLWSARETQDFYQCIEWAAAQPWSNGKIGLNGISYFGMNQWQVAALQPPHLAAMCVWEGATDFYRELGHHGGIFCSGMSPDWSKNQVWTVQYGRGTNGWRSRMNGRWVSGDETLTPEQLAANRNDIGTDIVNAKLATDPYWTSRTPDWSKIKTPLLSTANWGGHGLHLRGNVEGWLAAGSSDKWLEIHGDSHWSLFYTNFGLDLQKRFFDYYLKGQKNGWEKQPRVLMHVRSPGEKYEAREEGEWPLARTDWTKYHLDADAGTLSAQGPAAAAASVTYEAFGDGCSFLSAPFKETTEITGPLAAKLSISSETEDADLFVVVQVFAPDMREVTFYGAVDPHQVVSVGWLRASHRKLDPEKSTPYRPWHTHDEIQKLAPGKIYEVEVEIWPTCLVVPPGHRLGLTILGRDYVNAIGGAELGTISEEMRGIGPFTHRDPRDRPAAIYGKKVTVHTGPAHPGYLLVPVVPPKA